jgi:O-antigen ligase
VGSLAVVLARPDVGIALLLLLTPLFGIAIGPGSVKYLVYLLAFGLLVYGMLIARSQARQAAPRSLTLGVFLFLGAAIVSAATGIDPGASVGRLVMLLAATALYLAVLVLCRERRQLLVVTAGALGALLVAGVHGLAQKLAGVRGEFMIVSQHEVLDRVQGAFGHPNEFGGYLVVVIPLALAVASSRRFAVGRRLLAAGALAVSVPALFYTYSRGPVAALAAGLLVWTGVVRPRLALPFAAAVAAGLFFLLPSALEERFDASATGSGVTLRSDIWRGALAIYSERPIAGVGPNNFSAAYEQLPTELPGAVQRRLLHTVEVLVPPYAENLYLHVLAEQGIVGLAALLLLLLAALLTVARGSRVRDPAGRIVCFGIGAGLVTLILHGLVQVTIFTQTLFLLVALLAVAGRFVTLDWFGEDDAQR